MFHKCPNATEFCNTGLLIPENSFSGKEIAISYSKLLIKERTSIG